MFFSEEDAKFLMYEENQYLTYGNVTPVVMSDWDMRFCSSLPTFNIRRLTWLKDYMPPLHALTRMETFYYGGVKPLPRLPDSLKVFIAPYIKTCPDYLPEGLITISLDSVSKIGREIAIPKSIKFLSYNHATVKRMLYFYSNNREYKC